MVEYIRLPDMVVLPDSYAKAMRLKPGSARYMEPGFYDGDGNKLGDLADHVANAKVVIEFAGVSFVWAAFSNQLEAKQRGDMLFENLPGTAPVTPFFSEWDPLASEPRIGSARFTLMSAQRARNAVKVVGRNDGDADLFAAAGFIVSANVPMPYEYVPIPASMGAS